jgi:hypothetical protein
MGIAIEDLNKLLSLLSNILSLFIAHMEQLTGHTY